MIPLIIAAGALILAGCSAEHIPGLPNDDDTGPKNFGDTKKAVVDDFNRTCAPEKLIQSSGDTFVRNDSQQPVRGFALPVASDSASAATLANDCNMVANDRAASVTSTAGCTDASGAAITDLVSCQNEEGRKAWSFCVSAHPSGGASVLGAFQLKTDETFALRASNQTVYYTTQVGARYDNTSTSSVTPLAADFSSTGSNSKAICSDAPALANTPTGGDGILSFRTKY